MSTGNARDTGIMVSVHMPAFNHERFVGEAIESVLMQEAPFPYEIVVGDDASTDATRDVVLSFVRKHPTIVRPILHDRNVGMHANDRSILEACRGRYVAWLEADDVITSPHKLRRQVELLEAHAEYSACFHQAGHIGGPLPVTWRGAPRSPKAAFDVDDLLRESHFIPSCTLMFRRELIRSLEWATEIAFLERVYCLRLAMQRPIAFLSEEMTAFRSHPDSVYGRMSPVQQRRVALWTHRVAAEHLGLDGRCNARLRF
jgi:glycosyltransferase involved in cell wall biosynthesis